MYSDLADKTVVITGASRGIGAGLVGAFRDQGSRVIAVTRGTFERDGVEHFECDIRDIARLDERMKRMEAEGERVDVLVNNAGVFATGDLINVPAADFDLIFDVNLRATFLWCQRVAQHMRSCGGGVIINAASYAARMALVSGGAYAASKAAVVSFTASMAAEWAPFGIRVNAFSPGIIPTDMTAAAIARDEAGLVDAIALRRLGTVEEVARVVLFLASDASSYITGENIHITGGKLTVQNPGRAWTTSSDE
jgi:3-oxoacyl-[acyl-carrier protein] reductase